jgi:hypothetical protein
LYILLILFFCGELKAEEKAEDEAEVEVVEVGEGKKEEGAEIECGDAHTVPRLSVCVCVCVCVCGCVCGCVCECGV